MSRGAVMTPMGTPNEKIQLYPESTDILLVAPHGIAEDDENTDRVTLQAANRLGCTAIINTGLPRKKLNLNSIPDAERHPAFIQTIKKALAPIGQTRMIWIHGMKDRSAESEACRKKIEGPIHCLIGCGLPDRLTAGSEIVTSLADRLNGSGLRTIIATDQRSKFRGYSARNMNQWFRISGYCFSRVESMQLELF